MKAIFALVLMLGVYAKSLRIISQPNMMLSKDLVRGAGDESFLTAQRLPEQDLEDNDYKRDNLQKKIFTKLQQYYLDRLQNQQRIPSLEDSDIDRTAYMLIKTMKQRDKRFTSYLTLCHFKICNMGRKRTTRYFHMIKSLHDDHT